MKVFFFGVLSTLEIMQLNTTKTTLIVTKINKTFAYFKCSGYQLGPDDMLPDPVVVIVMFSKRVTL
jgi:hypothetical protein